MNKEEIEKEKRSLRCIHLADRNNNNLCDAIKRVEYLEQENNKLNKINTEMIEQLVGLTIWDVEKDEPLILANKEEVIQYFEKKVEEK